MFNFRTSNLLSIVLLLILFLPACSPATIADGQVVGLQFPTTVSIIKTALCDGQGTRILADPTGQAYVMTKALSDGIGFVILQPQTSGNLIRAKELTGNFTTVTTMSELEKFLLGRGWQVIPAYALPTWVQELASVGEQTIRAASYTLTTVFVVPAGIFIDPPTTEVDG